MADVKVNIGYDISLGDKSLVLDNNKYKLLKIISTNGSLKVASKGVGVSYRTALNYIKKIESSLGVKVVTTTKGGKGGGGATELTDEGRSILHECAKIDAIMKLHKNINEIPCDVVEMNHDKGVMAIKFGNHTINTPLNNEFEVGDKVFALINYDNIVIMLKPQMSSIRNILDGTIVEMKIEGEIIRVKVDVDNVIFSCDITVSAEEELKLTIGKRVFLGFKAMSVATLKMLD